MKDGNETRRQLINELVELRQRISKPENPTPTSKESGEPWSLKIFTLGRFSVIKDGKPLQSSRRVPKQTLLLLKALIALGGRGVAEGRLADIFWPRAEGDAAHSAFSSAIHRLRRLLGK
jgi:LuxR family maltose regulon positive regulatory protein